MASTASILGVRVAGESHALPAGGVAEIMRVPPWTRVPHGPASLLGLVNLRGVVLPLVSLARLLGRESAAPTGASRVVVLERGVKLGLLVDEVTRLAGAGDTAPLELDVLLARDFGRVDRPGGRQVAVPRPEAGPSHTETDERLAMIAIAAAGQDYAWPLDQVQEVVRLPSQATDVPQSDQAFLGVMALRDRLLPLVWLRPLLGLRQDGFDRAHARVVVTRLGSAAFGLVVDAVRDIVRVDAAKIDAVPAVLTRGTGEARIEGICRLDGGRRLICILSPARLFDESTAARIRAQAEQQEEHRMSAMAGSHEAAEQFVIFRLGEEQYGLPIGCVDEVVRRPDLLTRVPRAPGFVEGVMNLRGRVVPVINQRGRFAVAGRAASGGRVVVVTMDRLQAGFIVDAVSEVLRVPAERLQPAPDLPGAAAPLFDRIAVEHDGRMILLIDPQAMLDQAERELLAAMAADTTLASNVA